MADEKTKPEARALEDLRKQKAQKQAEYRKKNPPTEEQKRKNAERSAAWRAKNPKYMTQYMKGYRPEHLEEMRAADRKWHAEHREEANAYRRQWSLENPEKEKASQNAWRAANRDHIRNQQLIKKYGIDLEGFNKIFETKGKVCCICGATESGNGRDFHLDHHRATLRIRGVLCHACNTMIGLARELVSTLQKAIDYLAASENPEITKIVAEARTRIQSVP